MKPINAQTRFSALVKQIEKSNKKFSTASHAQKIVMVAKDVLDLLHLNRIKAMKGTYVHIPLVPSDIYYNVSNSQVSDILKMPSLPTCNVCAIGGAMLATTLRLNNVIVDDSYNLDPRTLYFDYSVKYYGDNSTNTGMSNRAQEVFSDNLLRIMERAFEDGSYGYGRFRSSNNRLKAIYQNLIDNKGKKFTAYRSPKNVLFSLPVRLSKAHSSQ